VEFSYKTPALEREERECKEVFKEITYKSLYIVSSDFQRKL